MLVVIPYNSEYGFLVTHLRALARQDFHEFDVIIVMEFGADATPIKKFLSAAKFDFSTIVVKRTECTGSAGAYFLGQKYALDNGYSCAVCADADCVPESRSLLRHLYSRKAFGFVSATMYAVRKGTRLRLTDPSVNHYSLFSREAMERFGLYFAPLFYYAEDGEYRERVALPRIFVPDAVTHPFKIDDALVRQDRSWYTLLNSVQFLRRPHMLYPYLVFFLFLTSAYLVFLQKDLRRLASLSLSMLLRYEYGKPALRRLKTEWSSVLYDDALPAEEKFARVNFENEKYASSDKRGKLVLATASSLGFFRKNVCMDGTISLTYTVFASMLARLAYTKMPGGSYLLLCDNRNPVFHAAKLVFFPLVFAAMLIVAVPLYLSVRLIRKPVTLGYGISQVKKVKMVD